jgi:hypothetical protein
MENRFENPPHQENKKINALDRIKYVLDHDIDRIYDLMLKNENVISSGLKPTKEQFRQYCALFQKGLEYVSTKYGQTALPENFSFYNGYMQSGDLTDDSFITYIADEDKLGVSFLHTAEQCARYDQPYLIFSDYHLPENSGVVAEDLTVLQAIEEGYHRHQIKSLGYKAESSMRDINHPLENEIIKIFEIAMKELNIQLRRIK